MRLKQFAYTIVRKVPLPTDLKVIDRSSLEQYKSVDLTKGNTETDEEPRGRKKNSPGMSLTKLLAKHIVEENKDIDFAFTHDFVKSELGFVRE